MRPLVLWEPIDGNRSKGRRRLSYADKLKKVATQQETTELNMLMLDRDAWKTTITDSREGVGCTATDTTVDISLQSLNGWRLCSQTRNSKATTVRHWTPPITVKARV